MRNKLLALGGMAVVAVILVVLTLVFKPIGAQSTCLTFIKHIQAGKADASYELFSESAKSQMSIDNWRTNVDSLQDFYAEQEPTFKTETAYDATPTSGQEHKEEYTIKTGSGSYALTCILDADKSTITAFSSEVKLPQGE